MVDSCSDESVLSAYLDNALGADEASWVAAHVQACPRCRRVLEGLRGADEAVRQLPAPEPSAEFERAFWNQVTTLEQKRAGPSWLKAWLGAWRPLTAAATAMLLAAGAYMTLHHRNQGRSAEEVFIAENAEFLNDYDLICHLELLEAWDELNNMEGPS
jgi:anti-sigma factor RsiW